MNGHDVTWDDPYSGNVDNIGVDPYSLSTKTPDVRAAGGNGASQNPLGGLAQALGAYLNRGGMTVDTGQPGATLGTQQPPAASWDVNLPDPSYTNPGY